MEDMHLTIGQVLVEHAASTPEAPAIVAPGRVPLTYAGLAAHIDDVGVALRAAGIGRCDRVALVLPTGPEMAVAFLAIASWAVCAPLNPASPQHELEAYLTSLKIKAVMLQNGEDSAVTAAAARLQLPVIPLSPCPDSAAGLFDLGTTGRLPLDADDRAHPDYLAVVMLTSGTTGQPKVVPLTHRNLCAAGRVNARALALTPDDRCLNVVPLFHSLGLHIVLASLMAGSSIVCLPTFDARQFFAYLDACQPTWYAGGPTMHHEILALAPEYQVVIARRPLRAIRSGAAALPAATVHDLERTFGAPVIKTYGMTEAGLIACTPLPPGIRKPGSVGVVADLEVAILGDTGEPLSAGQEGEIVARGASVITGYEGDDADTGATVADSWFRTGDLGYLDDDGYLFLTGRIKEIINRGGQKVSPYEVEAVLLTHPAVKQAAVFALPHPTLGEDVAAALVLMPDMTVPIEEVRTHVATHLAPFKIPRRIVMVDRLPTSAASKVQRLGLAGTLGLTPSPDLSLGPQLPATTPLETQLVEIWEDLFGIHPIGIQDDFFDLGGHSLLAARLMERLRDTVNRDLPVSVLFQNGTIEQLARLLEAPTPAVPWPSLVAIQPHGAKPPFFCVHALFGDVGYYADLAQHLGPDQPVYGFQAQGLDGSCAPLTQIEAMAAHYVTELRGIQPHGPYSLGGHSGGGAIALEMAQQLRAAGEEIALLAMFDALCPGSGYDTVVWNRQMVGHVLRSLVTNAPYWLATLLRHGPSRLVTLARQGDRPIPEALNAFTRLNGNGNGHSDFTELRGMLAVIPGLESSVHWPDHRFAVARSDYQALQAYTPAPYPGRVTLFRAHRQPILCSHEASMGWNAIAQEGVAIHVMPGGHDSMLYRPYVWLLARKLASCFA